MILMIVGNRGQSRFCRFFCFKPRFRSNSRTWTRSTLDKTPLNRIEPDQTHLFRSCFDIIQFHASISTEKFSKIFKFSTITKLKSTLSIIWSMTSKRGTRWSSTDRTIHKHHRPSDPPQPWHSPLWRFHSSDQHWKGFEIRSKFKLNLFEVFWGFLNWLGISKVQVSLFAVFFYTVKTQKRC